jgi:hypothetical protein
MATQIQLRRGTSTQHNSFTGVAGEVTVDTTTYQLHVHDGSTVGGFPTVLATSGTLTTPTITNPTITNYTETVYTANSSTAITLSLANGTIQLITLTGNCTITLPTVSAGKSFTVILRMGSGGYAVTWASPGSVHYWPNNITPTITGTASKTDIFTFVAAGGYWWGNTAGQAYNV